MDSWMQSNISGVEFGGLYTEDKYKVLQVLILSEVQIISQLFVNSVSSTQTKSDLMAWNTPPPCLFLSFRNIV
jgi:hypothetical protein